MCRLPQVYASEVDACEIYVHEYKLAHRKNGFEEGIL